ncbi:hypothetical protein [Pararhizobium qamdonense]|nr:hypothetical protein [Pararhizobium qamdonense]
MLDEQPWEHGANVQRTACVGVEGAEAGIEEYLEIKAFHMAGLT